VRLGDRDLEIRQDNFHVILRKAQDIIFHPKYEDDSSAYYDVAVVKLDQSVRFSDFIKPVCLPRTFDRNVNAHQGKFVVLTGNYALNPIYVLKKMSKLLGWGLMNRNDFHVDGVLRQVPLNIYSHR